MRLTSAKGKSSSSGFTLLELLTVVALVGILAAIAVPAWLRFMATQRVIAAQSSLRQGIQQAQLSAQKNQVLRQFSVRNSERGIEISIHSRTTPSNLSNWKSLGNEAVQIDSETSFYASDEIYYVRFDEKGNVRASRLGRVTVSSKQFPDIRRCVFVSTLLGATRSAKGQTTPDDSGRFCY